ncbi:MAG: substrate-binding domain-containing protein [Candidatus Limiplasma sp.]|nr:substrate-binding domain-containing protein [Candidatus Limiplasma sp.]MEA5144743.1 substrate-binding domain-containing protein [Candidatus Limiplasma sp.]
MKKKGAEPTITEVAELAGVSIATVSRVLNEKGNVRHATVAKVSAAMEHLGYQREEPGAPARKGLIVVVLPNLDNPFYAMIVKGIQVSAKNRGLETLIFVEGNLDGHTRRLTDLLHMVSAGGCILLSPVNDAGTLAAIDRVAPLVQCAEYNENSPLPYVSVDDYTAAKNAVHTLLTRGRKRVALINGPDKYKYARQRYRGYADALLEAGIGVDASLVCKVTEMGFDTSFAVARQLLTARERPDAILAASDMFAAAVVKAASIEGVAIPGDCALIGFDNTYISMVSHPSVAAVNMPQFQLGYMACEVLGDKMQDPSAESRQVLLKTELVLRDSV